MCHPKANNNSRINSTNTFEFNATMSTGFTLSSTPKKKPSSSAIVNSFEHEAVESVSPLHQENVVDPPLHESVWFCAHSFSGASGRRISKPLPPPVQEEPWSPKLQALRHHHPFQRSQLLQRKSLPSNGSVGAVECVDCLAIPASLALFFTLRRPLAGLGHKARKLNKKHKHPRPPHHLLLPLMGKRSSPKPRPYPTRSSSTSLPEFKQDRWSRFHTWFLHQPGWRRRSTTSLLKLTSLNTSSSTSLFLSKSSLYKTKKPRNNKYTKKNTLYFYSFPLFPTHFQQPCI